MMKDQQDSSERSFQQKFLQDFRDQNMGKRFGMTSIGSAQRPGSNLDEAANSDVEANSKRKRLEDRRLDLVA